MSTTHASLGMTLLGLLDRLAAIDAKLRQRAELGRLDARTLRDVGLSRAEIDAEIRRLAGGMSAGGQVSGETKSPPPEIVR